MSIQLKDYIKVFPDAIDHKFCSDLIKNKKYKYEHTVILDAFLTRKKDTTIRNCLSTPLLKEDDEIVFQAVGKIIHKYIEESKIELSGEITDSGYEILKYEKGGFYVQHTDDNKDIPRRIAISFLINDEYEGGEFQFFGDYKIQGKTGSAIIFPANFCYPHEVLPVKSGTRYSIITWVF